MEKCRVNTTWVSFNPGRFRVSLCRVNRAFEELEGKHLVEEREKKRRGGGREWFLFPLPSLPMAVASSMAPGTGTIELLVSDISSYAGYVKALYKDIFVNIY